MKNIKEKNGVTLITIVITIIILLILVGVAILQLNESKLLEKARLAKEKAKSSQIKEEKIIENYENEITEYINGTREKSIGTWKKWTSGIGYTSKENSITLPEDYFELLIEVTKENKENNAYSYSFNICKDMLKYDEYKYYTQGYGYNNFNVGASVGIKEDKVFLYIYNHYNNDYTSTGTMTIYYR